MRVKSLITWADKEIEYRSIKEGNIYDAYFQGKELFVETPGGQINLEPFEYVIIEEYEEY